MVSCIKPDKAVFPLIFYSFKHMHQIRHASLSILLIQFYIFHMEASRITVNVISGKDYSCVGMIWSLGIDVVRNIDDKAEMDNHADNDSYQ